MKKVTFKRNLYYKKNGFYVSEGNEDMSGTYVLASDAEAELAVLRAEVERLKTCCTIEAMIANPNVNSLITQHEKTIDALRDDLAEAVGIVQKLSDLFYNRDLNDVEMNVVVKARAFLTRMEVRT